MAKYTTEKPPIILKPPHAETRINMKIMTSPPPQIQPTHPKTNINMRKYNGKNIKPYTTSKHRVPPGKTTPESD